MPRGNNSKIEKKRIRWLTDDLNNKLNSNDNRLTQDLSSLNININDVYQFVVAGGCENHFDIIILMKDGRKLNIEHKGITIDGKKSPQNVAEHPWCITPQLVNLTCNSSSITVKYCKLWYYDYIPKIKEKFGDDLPSIPSFDIWVIKDAPFGDAKTTFGKALKHIKSTSHENKIFIERLVYDSLNTFWKSMLRDTVSKKELEVEILTTAQFYLSEKDVWMNAFYNDKNTIDTSIMFLSITPQISNLSIVSIMWGAGKKRFDENPTKKSKVLINYNLSSNPNKLFQGVLDLNFGNGNGLANIRCQIRGNKK